LERGGFAPSPFQGEGWGGVKGLRSNSNNLCIYGSQTWGPNYKESSGNWQTNLIELYKAACFDRSIKSANNLDIN
jgi:hypothetical protein